MFVGSFYSVKTIPGILRPPLSTLVPREDGGVTVLLDVGANADCKPDVLYQFGVLGSLFSKHVCGIKNPKVSLLNLGEEKSKGNMLTQATYMLMEGNPDYTFIGNCEGRDVLSGDFDVVVCDGFTGNVLLKFLESVGSVLLGVLRAELPRGRRGKVGSAFLRNNLKRIKKRLDHAEHGGALLLGVNGICVIGHGSSKSLSVVSALRLAHSAVNHNVMENLNQLQKLQVLNS